MGKQSLPRVTPFFMHGDSASAQHYDATPTPTHLKFLSIMVSYKGMLAWVAGTMSPHIPSNAAAAMERKTVDFPAVK